MPVQTSYSTTHNSAYAGMPVDLQLCNKVSKLNTSDEPIAYGKGVVSSTEIGAELPTSSSTAAEFCGVVMYELNRAHRDGVVSGAVPNYEFTAISFGAVWVVAASAVTRSDPVFLRVGETQTGDFSNAAGTGATASVQIPNAKFLGEAAPGQLVKISLGLGG
ncbi:structural cement protein Gp24 [Sessilibacter corallicola]|uniref:structural cement protein Gp24 n=1 Tax=Sessilibacter corallicola TaxID=2904075 RepID=UPI001E4B0D61|nr:hypothetical protein [Sessilibacter corallicola]MCE2029284.1 hypothetical protein [Sessilibacter corallicola]